LSASSTVQLKALLRRYLIADPGVAALAGERVYGAHLEDDDAGTTLQAGPLLVYEFLSGVLRWHAAVSLQTVELYAYSKNSGDEAAQLYDAAADALQHTRVAVNGVDPVALPRETQRPLDGYNPRLDAWFVRGRWTVEVS
jgi:hypothetical protein